MSPVRSVQWNPLSLLPTVAHGRAVDVICTDAMIHHITVTHGEPRAHGATLTVALPPLATLWRYA